MDIKKLVIFVFIVGASVLSQLPYFVIDSAFSGDEVDSSPMQQIASNQETRCEFDALVLELSLLEESLPPEQYRKGYAIDENPKWKLVLGVLPHSGNIIKMPFQEGRRECYIEDTEAVFGLPYEQVSGKYHFSFVWNIDVPGKSEFSNFKAVKIE